MTNLKYISFKNSVGILRYLGWGILGIVRIKSIWISKVFEVFSTFKETVYEVFYLLKNIYAICYVLKLLHH